jgi:hypothetical protein
MGKQEHLCYLRLRPLQSRYLYFFLFPGSFFLLF